MYTLFVVEGVNLEFLSLSDRKFVLKSWAQTMSADYATCCAYPQLKPYNTTFYRNATVTT